MKKLLLIGFAIVLLILAGRAIILNSLNRVLEEAKKQEVAAPDHKPMPLPKITSDFDWSNLDEEGLKSLTDKKRDVKNGPKYQNAFTAVLAKDETLITSGYEKELGVFSFVGVTANEYITEDGKTLIKMGIEKFEVTLGGKKLITSLPQVLVEPGSPATVSSKVNNPSDSSWIGYSIQVEGDFVPGGIAIQGSIEEN